MMKILETAAPDLLSDETIVAVANEVASVRPRGAALRQLVEGADLVFAVWPDPAEDDGVGIMIVKGRNRLGVSIATDQAEVLRWTAVPCRDVEQAAALRFVADDGAEVLQ